MNSNLVIGSIVYGIAGKPAKLISIDGDRLVIETGAGKRIISLEAVARVESPPLPLPAEGFHIGDRVTLKDRYMVRAVDIGTVEAFTDLGVQVKWDNNSPHEQLKELPPMQRTYQPEELELIDRT